MKRNPAQPSRRADSRPRRLAPHQLAPSRPGRTAQAGACAPHAPSGPPAPPTATQACSPRLLAPRRPTARTRRPARKGLPPPHTANPALPRPAHGHPSPLSCRSLPPPPFDARARPVRPRPPPRPLAGRHVSNQAARDHARTPRAPATQARSRPRLPSRPTRPLTRVRTVQSLGLIHLTRDTTRRLIPLSSSSFGRSSFSESSGVNSESKAMDAVGRRLFSVDPWSATPPRATASSPSMSTAMMLSSLAPARVGSSATTSASATPKIWTSGRALGRPGCASGVRGPRGQPLHRHRPSPAGAETYYMHAKWPRPKLLSRLKGLIVNALLGIAS
uniref:Uncharacterized protein n=1 Tax=Ananas comosus var. bracteatus TaxID=296719 RepID=A0A6V7NWE2_ANACO|nr:unnamed protein product [Ananas comosus var. bracteatus]